MKKLKEIMNKSDIPTDEKNELVALLNVLDQRSLIEICGLFEEEPSLIKVLSENLKAKKEVIKNHDTEGWNKIIESEVQLLEKTDS